ncbi:MULTISPECIES: polysaccharide deacetylase family protein [Bacillus]|uniref:polysaccharide deacetylase family protein n=1 Tax=Bacillus TaxID=1386 RepID=UPI0007DB4348|nr:MULTISPECIES: polysaccharide deacetylase family protein [Bacillus]OAK35997.1 transcriptional regulator [Bacillus wiedmannii]OJD38397.1 transcriptional regulator [Bacillus sp. 4048]HDR7661876.1 polysaccharide deacetylase family protein [Bacillus wiedmannii]
MKVKNWFVIIISLILLISVCVFAFNKTNKKEAENQKIPVLMYHHLLKENDKKENDVFKDKETILSVEQFEKQMKYLNDKGYKTITMKEFEEYMKNKGELSEKSVLITFDDSSKTNYTYAYPILKKYKMKATAFVVTSRLTDKEEVFDSKKIQPLSKHEINKMKDVFEFGSYTHDLFKLSKNGEAYLVSQPDSVVKEDLSMSKSILKTDYFAYPFGEYNEKSISLLNGIKFNLAFTNNQGYANRTNKLMEIKRFPISPEVDMKKFSEVLSGIYKVPEK